MFYTESQNFFLQIVPVPIIDLFFTQGVIDKLNAENESLKKQMENKHETLKRDNVWLVNAVQGLKDETMELQR